MYKIFSLFFLIISGNIVFAQSETFFKLINKCLKEETGISNTPQVIRGVFFEKGAGNYYGKIWIITKTPDNIKIRYLLYHTGFKSSKYSITKDTVCHLPLVYDLIFPFISENLEPLRDEFYRINELIGIEVVRYNVKIFQRDITNGIKYFIALNLHLFGMFHNCSVRHL